MTDITFEAIGHRLARQPPREVEITRTLREAAVALVLAHRGDGGLAVLLIKRANAPGDPWSGQMAFPGGRRDPRDPDLFGTAVRETREETAIDLSRAQLLGQLDDLSPVSPHLPQIVVRPFVFGVQHLPDVVHSREVALHLWAGFDELNSSRVTESLRIGGRDLTVGGYRLGEHLVWGMTERILSHFIGLIPMG